MFVCCSDCSSEFLLRNGSMGWFMLTRLDRAGFFPGAILLISKWYLPGESQTRIAIFFTASAIAGAFSGLLAFGIANMDGVGGYEGWRWVI